MASAYGPMARARAGVEARRTWQPLHEQLIEISNASNHGTVGTFSAQAEYLSPVISPGGPGDSRAMTET